MEEISLKQILKTVYKNRKILIGIVIATILIGMIYSFIIVRPEYQSTSKVLISSNDASIKEFVKSKSMIEKCIEKLGNSKINVTFVKQNANISFDTATKLVTVSITTNDKALSNEIVLKYIDVLKTELENVYNIKSYTVIEESREASAAANIHHKKDIMVAGILGVIIAFLYVIIILFIDNTTTNSASIEEATGAKVIGKIKKETRNKKVIDYFMHDIYNLNGLNKMAVTVQMKNKTKKVKSILISGTGIGAGSTYITTNLANTYAKLGYKVLVIDSNKNGVQNKIFNTTLNKGFSDLVLRMENSNIENINIDEYIAKTPISGVYVMAYGEEKLNERMLISEKSAQIFDRIFSKFDIILIDAPTIKKDVTTLILSTFTDSFILVAEYRKTKLNDIEEVKESLENIEQEISGIILNKIED